MKRGTQKLSEKMKSKFNITPFELIVLGTPRAELLEKSTSPITEFSSKLRQEIKAMKLTANEYGASGLSANQVGLDKRMFIMAKKLTEGIWLQQNSPSEIEYRAIINPEITEESKLMQYGWEYCASIPNIRAVVKRHEIIKVQYIDENMREVKEELSGFAARIFQHEIDHLNGSIMLQESISHDELESLSDTEDGDIEVAKVIDKFYSSMEKNMASDANAQMKDKMPISEEELAAKLKQAAQKDYLRREKQREKSSTNSKKRDPNYFY